MLNYFGRKTLMVGGMGFCIIGMFGMWIFNELVDNEAMMYVLTIAFIFGFEFGPGPIVWLYLSEICDDKATSVDETESSSNQIAKESHTLVIR